MPTALAEQPLRRTRKRPPTAATTSRGRIVWGLSLANLVLVLAAWGLIAGASERTWLSAAMVFLPRWPYLIPAAILLLVACFRCPKAVAANLAAIAIVVWPIMGLQIRFGSAAVSSPDDPRTVRLLSCNVQSFRPDFSSILYEIDRAQPDLIVFQEAFGEYRSLDSMPAGWHQHRFEEYFVASRFPLTRVATCNPVIRDRSPAVMLEIDHPQGKFRLVDVHLTSPRYGLLKLRPKSLVTGSGTAEAVEHTRFREEEALAVRSFVEEHRDGLPVILTGDFNMPTDSHLYTACFSDFQNAFESAGSGYGYTAPCATSRYWPANTPWSRIDHVLADSAWNVQLAEIGRSAGSDHRLVWSVLSRRTVP